NKRPYEKVDTSAQVLDRLRKRAKPSLPDPDELATFEQSLTDDIKIPLLSAYTFITGVLGSAIMTPSPAPDGTFVTFWDINIRRFLETFFPIGRSVRNTNQHMSTNNMHSNFGFILNQVCLFRGEEKTPNSREEVWAELVEKIQWIYDPAPYVLGYYAIGPSVTYVALCRPRSGNYKPDIITIGTVDLSLRKERIRNLRILINLCSIIEPINDVIGWRETAEESKTICITGTSIKKTYHGPDGEQRIQKLRNIYNILRSEHVPNVDDLILSYTDNDHGSLTVMHEAETPIFHRDIRWPNIIQLHGSQWILIDWEDASSMPTRAPEVFKDDYKGEVDIWSVS
ncbi:2607_t:CDS:2, partial [Ambispora leptoticha]